MLTALDEVSHRVEGLTAGADDYLCKPFDFDELLARVAALARRGQSSEPKHKEAQVIALGNLQLDREQRIAKLYQNELSLTKIEFSLLLYFAENRDKVLSRERILARVWQTKSDPNTNVVDVYISHLRKKLARGFSSSATRISIIDSLRAMKKKKLSLGPDSNRQ